MLEVLLCSTEMYMYTTYSTYIYMYIHVQGHVHVQVCMVYKCNTQLPFADVCNSAWIIVKQYTAAILAKFHQSIKFCARLLFLN